MSGLYLVCAGTLMMALVKIAANPKRHHRLRHCIDVHRVGAIGNFYKVVAIPGRPGQLAITEEIDLSISIFN